MSGAEASKLLELVEASFDAVALFVEFTVVGSGLLPVPARRDDGDRGFGLPAFQQKAWRVVISFPVQL